jgi:hypothetical protein
MPYRRMAFETLVYRRRHQLKSILGLGGTKKRVN